MKLYRRGLRGKAIITVLVLAGGGTAFAIVSPMSGSASQSPPTGPNMPAHAVSLTGGESQQWVAEAEVSFRGAHVSVDGQTVPTVGLARRASSFAEQAAMHATVTASAANRDSLNNAYFASQVQPTSPAARGYAVASVLFDRLLLLDARAKGLEVSDADTAAFIQQQRALVQAHPEIAAQLPTGRTPENYYSDPGVVAGLRDLLTVQRARTALNEPANAWLAQAMSAHTVVVSGVPGVSTAALPGLLGPRG